MFPGIILFCEAFADEFRIWVWLDPLGADPVIYAWGVIWLAVVAEAYILLEDFELRPIFKPYPYKFLKLMLECEFAELLISDWPPNLLG
jgi:hypothetical protein